MPIEYHQPALGSDSVVAARFGPPSVDQSGSEDADFWLSSGDAVQSLAMSHDAGCMQYALMEVTRDFFLRAGASLFGLQVSRSHFPMLIDEVCIEQFVARGNPSHDPRYAQLVARLRAGFEADPLEDGMDHPAERVIGEALRSAPAELVLDWFGDIVVDPARPSFAASVLRCLGRQSRPGTASWRAGVVRGALAQDDVELRDAAVQAAELWADREAVDVLMSHREPEPWLRQYVLDVIDDLGD